MSAHHRDVTGRIRHIREAVSFDAPRAAEVFRLAAARTALRLEINCPGLRVSRHGSAVKLARQLTGLKTHDMELLLSRIERLLECAHRSVIVVNEQEALS